MVQPVTAVALVYAPGDDCSNPSFTQGATFTNEGPPFFFPAVVITFWEGLSITALGRSPYLSLMNFLFWFSTWSFISHDCTPEASRLVRSPFSSKPISESP